MPNKGGWKTFEVELTSRSTVYYRVKARSTDEVRFRLGEEGIQERGQIVQEDFGQAEIGWIGEVHGTR
jgi:hypothetical protein